MRSLRSPTHLQAVTLHDRAHCRAVDTKLFTDFVDGLAGDIGRNGGPLFGWIQPPLDLASLLC
jgi:hypothetical protein